MAQIENAKVNKPQSFYTNGYLIIHMDTLLPIIELRILSLYTSDYSTKLHVRESSRILKTNHRTISLALQKLEKNRIMDSTVIGKSRQYHLNLKNVITKEFIKTAESYKSINFLNKNFLIKKLMDELSNIVKTTPVFLFGSYAKGTETKESDIDIAIIKDSDELNITKLMKDFAQRHNKNIQIQKFDKEQFESGIKKNHLIIEIVKNHIILNNNEQFIDILWRHYNDR